MSKFTRSIITRDYVIIGGTYRSSRLCTQCPAVKMCFSEIRVPPHSHFGLSGSLEFLYPRAAIHGNSPGLKESCVKKFGSPFATLSIY